MKKVIIIGISFLVGSLFLSCSDDSPTQTEMGSSLVCNSQENCTGVTLQDGFALIRSAGKYTEMGTNSKSAKANERPQMDVKFSYDFQIGKHEVTCGEFNSLMDGKNGVKLDCEKESLPATNVTYYDAVLYANAKSKAAGLDTAYSYSSADFDKKGHCTLLNGFVFRTDVDAFRLPTEAEWIFAANLSFNVDKSWKADNSGSKVHEVCSKKDENGLCDFLGNVTEWVNDWLGYFRDTSITNYVGGVDGGNLGERVIKGGSYRTAISDINLYARGDVYTVTGTSASDYLGFRLAYGKIENPVWLDASGAAVASNLSLVASAKNISPFFGTYKSKLAFRNQNTKNLVFVDFRRVSPSIVEIKDTLDVYHPDISPDGKRVAFCTGLEGYDSDTSALYVRDLNAEGSNLVKLDVKGAAIPRWRVLDNGDTVIVYVTNPRNNKDDASFKSTSTWQVKFANGTFGKPEKLFDGAYHGGISEDESLTVTGARVLRARVAAKGSTVKSNAKDTLWYNGEQACNASLNKKSKRTLFLDFASETGSKFVGSKYRVHERLLIADNNGKLVSAIASPSGYLFDHCEWVLNDENVAVVTLTNAEGAHKQIALVNTKDSSLTVLVEGDDIWHPCFWVSTGNSSESSNWNADSVGVYVSAANQTNYLLSHKMPMFWKLKDSVEFIGLGNSHMWADFDPSEMSVSAMNMGVVPCDMHCIHYLFENYVVNHASKVKYVAVGLDFDLWSNIDHRADINECRGDALGFVYDEKHEFYPEGVDEAFVNLVMENAVDEVQSEIKQRGWYAASDNMGWADENGHVVIDPDSMWSNCLFNKNLANCLVDENQNTCLSKYTMDVCMNEVADTSYNMCLAKNELNQCLGVFSGDVDKLKNLVRIAKEHDIVVIGVVFPVSPEYKKTGAYSRHGMLRSHAKKILDEINEFADGKSNFFVFDENKFGEHDYPSSMANDYDHLNKDGAKQFSKRLNEFVKSLEGKSSK